MSKNKILALVKKNEEILHEKYKVKALYLFGSTARGQATRQSDIDILVEFSSHGVGFFDFVNLKTFLEKLLKARVDLVTRDAIKQEMRAGIEKDLIRAA